MIWVAIFITVVYLSYGTLFYGTRNSISKLAVDWNKWLFTAYIVVETFLILPYMFEITLDWLRWMVWFIGGGLLLLAGAAIDNKDDLKYHYVGSVIACLGSLVWLCFINPVLLFVPLLMVSCGDKTMWQWNGELGIIMAIYLALAL